MPGAGDPCRLIERLWRRFTKDISRSGISFLHAEQLLPDDHVRILTPNATVFEIQIKWCKPIQARCFAYGAEIRNVDRMARQRLLALCGTLKHRAEYEPEPLST